MTVKLNDTNFMMFAIKNYENPQCEGIAEFHEDLQRVKYIKRLFSKYLKNGVLRERLILNHIIILSNLFGPQACTRILFFNINTIHHSYLKTFLYYLNYLPASIPEINLNYVNLDNKILSILEKME